MYETTKACVTAGVVRYNKDPSIPRGRKTWDFARIRQIAEIRCRYGV